ncbi:MAG TPA: asparaginase domain-containing protein, partial [Candidatus Limnocylindria bacterium]
MIPKIAVVATGGTIQNSPDGRVPIADVWDHIGGYARDPRPTVTLDIHDILRAGSETFGAAEWQRLAQTVQQRADDRETDGVVVTHGTFTAEESAYFLNLAIDTDKPVAVVVSQRKHGTAGNDGDRNLIDAIRVASSPDAGEIGVVLVANEEIHGAREVTKENQRPGAFVSTPVGPLGTVELDRVSIYRAPTRRHTTRSALARVDLANLPRVDIVAGYAGADGSGVSAAVAAGARAIVLAGFAYSGRGSDPQMEALEEAARSGT